MQNLKDFTVDPHKFPGFENLVAELKEEGIHLIPIIDAGVKAEAGYEIYEEGIKNGYFIKMRMEHHLKQLFGQEKFIFQTF